MRERFVMPRCIRDVRALAALIVIAMICGCAPAVATPAPVSTPTPAATGLPATLDRFLDAYNAGDVARALSLLTDDALGSDCDYRQSRVIFFNDRDAFASWLRERVADHDRLVRGDVISGAAGQPVLGVPFVNRTSDTLRSLGFARGIAPSLTAKVVFSDDGSRIKAFANGPGGGDQALCRPT